jgi:hypothetical protein
MDAYHFISSLFTLWASLSASDFPSSVAGYCGGRALFELGASPYGLPTSLCELRRDKSTPQDDATSRPNKAGEPEVSISLPEADY